MRDLRRHLQDIPESSLRDRIIATPALVSQLLHQAPKGADKIYALHEPGWIASAARQTMRSIGERVEGQGPGAPRVWLQGQRRHTLDEGFVVGMRSFAGNPCDGHT